MKDAFEKFFALVGFIAFIFVVIMFYRVFVEPKINGGTVIVVYPTQPAAYQPTQIVQPVQPIVVEPTWTPFYIISAPSTPEPAQNLDHVRTGITPGTTGNHDTGRTDNRTP